VSVTRFCSRSSRVERHRRGGDGEAKHRSVNSGRPFGPSVRRCVLPANARRPLTTVSSRRSAVLVTSLTAGDLRYASAQRIHARPDPLSRLTRVASLSARQSCKFRPRNGCSKGEPKISDRPSSSSTCRRVLDVVVDDDECETR
jgi:hypothetical protein